ncbi:D-arabinono-1,4-lactone oxidase [Hufsiella ginkgonis]|uniref:FAD-binding protein n=1 Tax=Hufsiella ginkgonis TaxID=2695274 RepID=A0A7K1XS50_9SPHI|nr:D-arabinono-1,4-lactone oxidase [Hufsiella ginkgonis]MXV13788.1 FAD-binding protein [Hufsiella ginkgonis]
MNPITTISTVTVGGVNYYLPQTIADLTAIVSDATAANKKISMRGSGHSFPLIPNQEAGDYGNTTYLLLSYFNSVSFNDEAMQVTVGGGCHLGYDPYDPTPESTGVKSTDANSLFTQVFDHGWAIPEMGGIKHQTVGGFLSTGSSGGSLKYSFDEMIESITLLTAESTPQLRTFSINDPDTDSFYAAGIALGMFGIIVSVTFNCVATFNIRGAETATYAKDCPIDLFGSSSTNLQSFFEHTDYARLMWWPQLNVQKMVVWQASQIPPEDGFTPKPYEEVRPLILGSEDPLTAAAGLLYSSIGYWPEWFLKVFKNVPGVSLAADEITNLFYPHILPAILDVFVNVGENQPFQDYWHTGLCMDNEMDDKLLPVKFTEIWIPMDSAQEVMLALQSFYGVNGQNTANTGYFSVEIYGAKASKFWMSPSYGSDMVRVDVFWFAKTDKDPVKELFQNYWDALESLNFRCHWGKYLPQVLNGKPNGGEYLLSQYPNFNKWNAIRQSLDPQGIFISQYWQNQLGLS